MFIVDLVWVDKLNLFGEHIQVSLKMIEVWPEYIYFELLRQRHDTVVRAFTVFGCQPEWTF